MTHNELRHAVRALTRRLVTMLVIVLAIAYLTQLGLLMAERGRQGVPAALWSAAGQALIATFDYLFHHPATYYWQKAYQPAFSLVWTFFSRSAGLLLVSLLVATLIGVPVGIAVARSGRARNRSFALLLSILGVSTPSFILAMMFWILNIKVHRAFDITVLPQTGFGWDAHLIMPALVLAARPLAQIVQVTYLTLADVLGQDYIRVAYSKGLSPRAVLLRHALRNVWIPVLTTLGTSLRFSLASLPVVESFFVWPGVGQILLQTIESSNRALITDLVVTLGILFLLLNLALEMLFPLLDPRLRVAPHSSPFEEQPTWRRWLETLLISLREGWTSLRQLLPGGHRPDPLPSLAATVAPEEGLSAKMPPSHEARRLLRSIVTNPALIVGTLLVAGLIGLVVAGDRLTTANPYETHGVLMIEGKIGAPPYAPSRVFPWGTDPVGRDIQALVLGGARRTLALAFFATLARMAIGALLGAMAGWWRGGWLDRLVHGAIAVWAAFPVTLFALILILALGIQQGMSVFIVGVSLVGWGEIAQFVRGQVISLKPQPYIEAARATGARTIHLLSRHILSILLPSLLVLSILEMGGVLMLLAELGFLNIFMGGGFRAAIAETGQMQSVIYFFSDVPEWGALLANVRTWWRSYPWLGWYPGLAFFLAILTFNLWGQGMRRFLDDTRANVSRLFNRYTVSAGIGAVVGLILLLRATSPLGIYRSQATAFDASRALQDIQQLASPTFAGRETGTPGAEKTAAYIAQRMAEIGLLPAGEKVDGKESFIVSNTTPRAHLTKTPTLEVLDDQDNLLQALTYRRDFVEYVGRTTPYARRASFGRAQGVVMGLVTGPDPETNVTDHYGLSQMPLRDKILIVRPQDAARINTAAAAAFLVASDDPLLMQRKVLYGGNEGRIPMMVVTTAVADRLLAPTGSSMAQMEAAAANLKAGEVTLTSAGALVRLAIEPELSTDLSEKYYHVAGFIPGQAAEQGLDAQVIMVTANYDGLGIGPDGTLYPGANDNASGVAVMLELARALKNSPYQPNKTVVFVAWAGGERNESLSIVNVMAAKIGFSSLRTEAVIELNGVGGGRGNALALGQGSSFRLVQLFQDAASRLGVATTTRGRDPHFGQPAPPGFGGRSALTVYLSWDGSDERADTAQDTADAIEISKLTKAGRTVLLALHTLSREVNY